MADILIRGMEMPKSCWDCKFNASTIDHHERCLLTKKTYSWGLTKPPSHCPMVELLPHGRLIDADALILRVNMHGTNKFGMLDEDIRQFIEAASTVIPASEEGT